MRSFRQRAPTVTLYHCVATWQADGILKNGFTDAASAYGQDKDRPASVAFSDVSVRGLYGGTTCIVIEVPEDAVLPHESIEGRDGCHQFAVPAEVANRYSRRVVVAE